MTYIYYCLTPRLAIAIGMAGVLTADSVWIFAPRDSDFFSTVNPWIALVLSIAIMIWGIVPENYNYHLDEALWFIHGWWMVLFVRIVFVPQPAQADGWDRVSWSCVYFSMSILSLGLWFEARRRHEFPQ